MYKAMFLSKFDDDGNGGDYKTETIWDNVIYVRE